MFYEIVSIGVFIFVMIAIITHKINRTTASMLGALIVIIIGVFEDQMDAFTDYIDFNTIFLLLGMMIFVNVLKKRNIFTFIGVYTLKKVGHSVKSLYFILILLVALISSVIDNVTTILIFIPISLAICDSLDLEYFPLILAEIFASNIGGTATIIGDPPNIMIASAANISFVDFSKVMFPLSLINLLALVGFVFFVFRKELNKKIESKVIDSMEFESLIENKKEFVLSFILLILVILLFVFQHQLNLEACIIAMIAAFFSLFLLERHDIDHILKEVEWESILFFMGLFIITGALEETGVLSFLADKLVGLTSLSSDVFLGLLLIISSSISGFLDNIPFTAAVIPVIENLIKLSPKINFNIWYYLSAGACVGGNMTSIGASANIIALALLYQFKGMKVSFGRFLKYGFFIVLINIIISYIYFKIIF
jgi:anion transporter